MPSIFKSFKTSCSPDSQALELENRDEGQNEAPQIQGKMVSDLLHHLDKQNSLGLDGIITPGGV